jgi:hypothetical protein
MFGASLPVAVVLRGGGPNLIQQPQPQAPGLGDVVLEARKRVLERLGVGGDGELHAAVGAAAVLPTADAGSWLGGAWALALDGMLTFERGPWRLDGGLGARLQAGERLATHEVDPATGAIKAAHSELTVLQGGSTVHVRLGGARALGDKHLVRLEGQVRRALPGIDATPAGQTVVDLALGGEARLADAWRVLAGVSGAPTAGPGSAALRLHLGVALEPGLLPADLDQDGILDRDDKCPAEAEDKDGFDDKDGCPDPDNDGDGVPDTADRCPLRAEDKDGFEDDDGCPDDDDDQDGIADALDRCPKEPEDKDGFEDNDGCPDPDNDGDGIKDQDDLCPLSPETKNGFEDGDGCPDVPPVKREAPPPVETPPPKT